MLLWTTNAGSFTLRARRCLESIFFHHPRAVVKVYSNELPLGFLRAFSKLGFDVRIKRYNVTRLLADTPAAPWLDRLDEWRRGPYYYSHSTDAVRLALLFRLGGTCPSGSRPQPSYHALHPTPSAQRNVSVGERPPPTYSGSFLPRHPTPWTPSPELPLVAEPRGTGVYMDTDVLLTRPVQLATASFRGAASSGVLPMADDDSAGAPPRLLRDDDSAAAGAGAGPRPLRDALGIESYADPRTKQLTLNGAVMAFGKGSRFLWNALHEFASDYKPDRWGWNGPELLTRVASRCVGVQVEPPTSFYPLHWEVSATHTHRMSQRHVCGLDHWMARSADAADALLLTRSRAVVCCLAGHRALCGRIAARE